MPYIQHTFTDHGIPFSSYHSPSAMPASSAIAAPTPLYHSLHDIALVHARPTSLEQILAIRAPSATHAWGHAYLVRQNPGLRDRMDNAAFAAHLRSTGRYLSSGESTSTVHDVVIDEHRRTAAVHMSYFLKANGSEEVVEQDLIWMLKFTGEGEGGEDGEVLIKESVEFIDAAASARVGTLVREVQGGELGEDVRGGITLRVVRQ